ncbi:gamma-glutamyl hydrolase A [Exaiptasia diaphana]|uniref:folate gamma-glutamyl hydrolase n=1 Tax=Exaiptasia diaphana TaxID=2652724 RepID=A0A913X6V6_EXADI|nr:gamma-glutamyl hydrolase A [Exaiptasia diaphana]KXJ14950.1 Gamma-glutamyl hydrolase A [Exaiptasia diaphana]
MLLYVVYSFVLLFCWFNCDVICRPTGSQESLNNRPIIGVLAQESPDEVAQFGKTFIPASYIKYLESAGARVVPIRNDLTDQQIQDLFSSINGVLFPGGDVDLWTSGYAKTARVIFDLAVKANDAGDVFPLWGTCLGFQMLHVLAANGKDILTSCKGENVSLPLNFTEGYEDSRMFGKAPQDIKTYLAKLPVTLNMHQNCVSVQTYKQQTSLNTFIKVLSTNMDIDNKVNFLSTVEAVKYPFYGTQWHPEKNQFEWTKEENINHSSEGVLVTQYVADFFVDQARLSKHHFKSRKEETSSLIYNYNPHLCIPDVSHYEQCYFF